MNLLLFITATLAMGIALEGPLARLGIVAVGAPLRALGRQARRP